MRLIDADEFMENLIYCDGLGRRGLEAVLKTLKEQPTAYDIEKVVEQLEDMKLVRVEQCYGDYEIEVMTNNNFFDAIDIVKRGGVE